MSIRSCLMLVGLSACSKGPDVRTQVVELEKAFPAAATPAPAQAAGEAPHPPSADANALVNAALSAVRTNDYASGVIALQAVQRMPGVTAVQLMTIERTMQAMTADLVSRAARGDAQAKAELAAIERTRSQ